jgi:hypothetical protein
MAPWLCSAAVSRDLPMPGSPEISTTRPSPLFVCCQRRTSSSTSSSRPTDQHPVAHVFGDKAVKAADRIGDGVVGLAEVRWEQRSRSLLIEPHHALGALPPGR